MRLKSILMKYYILLLLSSLLFFSCEEKPKTENTETRTEAVEEQAQKEFEKFGKEITADGAIVSSEILAQLEVEDSIYVKMQSEVSAVCKKKGCWMTVPLNDETEMRVKFKDYDFFVPLNCEGKNTIVEGWAYKNVITVAMLKHYAEDGGATQEEIDAITEAETEYTFMADGVLMN